GHLGAVDEAVLIGVDAIDRRLGTALAAGIGWVRRRLGEGARQGDEAGDQGGGGDADHGHFGHSPVRAVAITALPTTRTMRESNSSPRSSNRAGETDIVGSPRRDGDGFAAETRRSVTEDVA